MITASNLDEITKQLEEYSKEVENRLKNMVAGFAREVSLVASRNTPVGNFEDMMKENSKYRGYYLQRQEDYGIPIEPGYHSGAWQYSEDTLTFQPMVFTPTEMSNDVYNEAEASYKLGDSFVIGAVGPGYGDLEAGRSSQAPQGIMQPTLAEIQAAHESDLKRYYDAG